MTRRYYSSRNNKKSISVMDLYVKLQNLYLLFRDKDFFKEKADITKTSLSDTIQQIAAIKLNFQPFPITKWEDEDITEENIFTVIEFLFDYVSKPGELEWMTSETGYNYQDYGFYDQKAGQNEFREFANIFLLDYKNGFELTEDGEVIFLGDNGLQYIINADIVPYDTENVDKKVSNALQIWKNRKSLLSDRRRAVQELADVFEWLKKSKKFIGILLNKDESDLFNIANNFAIRHHNPKQKSNYDENIWYSWIFHFYLATYHAVIRMIIKNNK